MNVNCNSQVCWFCVGANFHSGTGAQNIIPGSAQVDFNFRFSTESTEESLKTRLEAVLRKHGLDHSIEWVLGGRPFVTQRGRLVEVVSESIHKHTGRAPELSTTGGTSDARFIADICPQVVEFGPAPLVRVLGPDISRVYEGIHRDHGVRFHFGEGVERFEGQRSGRGRKVQYRVT